MGYLFGLIHSAPSKDSHCCGCFATSCTSVIFRYDLAHPGGYGTSHREDSVNEALVVMLAFVWALLLLPGAIRSRRRDDADEVRGFPRGQQVLADAAEAESASPWTGLNAQPTLAAVPAQSVDVEPAAAAPRPGTGYAVDPVLVRRQRVTATLGVVVALTTVVAALLGGASWLAPALATAAFGGYLALLRRWKLQRDEARALVAELRAARAAAQARRAAALGGQRAVGDTLWAANAVAGQRRGMPRAGRGTTGRKR